MSKESGAISLLCRAVELDSKNNKTSALVCYKEGLQMLLEVIRTGMYFNDIIFYWWHVNHYLKIFVDTIEPSKKAKFREKVKEYMNRAETLQVCFYY